MAWILREKQERHKIHRANQLLHIDDPWSSSILDLLANLLLGPVLRNMVIFSFTLPYPTLGKQKSSSKGLLLGISWFPKGYSWLGTAQLWILTLFPSSGHLGEEESNKTLSNLRSEIYSHNTANLIISEIQLWVSWDFGKKYAISVFQWVLNLIQKNVIQKPQMSVNPSVHRLWLLSWLKLGYMKLANKTAPAGWSIQHWGLFW